MEEKGPAVSERAPDPYWPTAKEWIASKTPRKKSLGSIGLLGLPLSRRSITPGRCDLATSAIRSTLGRFSTFDVCRELDLTDLRVKDFGDLDISSSLPDDAAEEVASTVRAVVQTVDALIILGGDNSITRPALHGLGAPMAECALVTLDAHFDLRDLKNGSTNGNPVRGLLADGLPGQNIVQIGIQSFANSNSYAQIARREGIHIIDIERVRAQGVEQSIKEAFSILEEKAAKIYVDFDIDVLDRAFAPACPGSRPGGLSPHELFTAARLCGLNSKVAAVDIVEVDPQKDVSDITVMAAANCLLSFAAGVRSRLNGRASFPLISEE
jgi:formiminoglutamase